jgi:pilus assembly protein CpaB
MAVRTRSLVLLFVALAAGGAAAWISLGYLRHQAQPLLTSSASAGTAVVASKDLPVGTVVAEDNVQLVSWPGDAVPAGLARSKADVVGRGIVTAMRLNEPFLESKLAPRGKGGGMPILITEGMRALSLRVDDVAAVAGFVVPGTRVDLLLTITPPGGGEPATKALMQNVTALAAGQSIQVDAEGKPQTVPVITLLVSPEQAETLALASGQGRLQMALRNAVDTLPIRTAGVRLSALTGPLRPVATTLAGPTPQAWRRTPPAIPTPVAEETIVEGFRGGERTLTKFTRPKPPAPQEER